MITQTHAGHKWARLALLIGDLAALILFIYVGQRDHGTISSANPIKGVLLALWEFALLWVAIAPFLEALPPFKKWTARSLIIRPLLAWLIVAPLGLLLRALVLARLNIPTLFLAATLGFGLVFLFVWRLLVVLIWKAATR